MNSNSSEQYSFPLNLSQCRDLEKSSRECKASKYSRYISTELYGLFIGSKCHQSN
jgi:hypothetical protein